MNSYRRGWHSYILLFAIVFKTLVLGMLVTLAIHNICLERLVSEETNWKQLVPKKRKRNDENPFITSFNVGEAIPVKRTVIKKAPLLLRILHALYQSLLTRIPGARYPLYPDAGYIPERIFLQYCILRR
jgi:hypothetical protein